jgi:hypothetical protein
MGVCISSGPDRYGLILSRPSITSPKLGPRNPKLENGNPKPI